MEPLSAAEIEALRAWPTPAISNAIETFDVIPRNRGFMSGIKCLFADLGPLVGYACTAATISDMPATEQDRAVTQLHWDNILATPGPRVAVIQDLDQPACIGAFWGEVNANIHRALGCSGVVTNGGVRDLDEVHELGFHFFAGEVTPAHAYVHLVSAGVPVKVGGLVVGNGDLIHADQHGVVVIPHEIARDIPGACQEVEDRERRIINFCKSPDFDVEKLKSGRF